ncbi:hypothetical protein [Parachitinimonas caeni]|uniref:Uncharacterized protein n=1 Tax=Parachitinimonas caeni TaxID=3031301 RepID=A0ABT7E010_9NEIS|nr:hypothetical protein [Parachitinimonas caeni]MDK2125643.1 hypothetical protein [Parachitinimonas caeni]
MTVGRCSDCSNSSETFEAIRAYQREQQDRLQRAEVAGTPESQVRTPLNINQPQAGATAGSVVNIAV